MKIYLAGGWFSPQQEEEHTRIYNLIKDNFEVFNPRLESPIGVNATDILLKNIEGIKSADIIVCITDYKDMGTLWESGFAYANNKIILYYAETLGNRGFNLMLAKTGYVAQTEYQLVNILYDIKTGLKTFKNTYEDYKGELE